MIKNVRQIKTIPCRVGEYSKSGSSTLEFIFCAPLLVVLMFVALEINERIEQRVNTSIAGGNLAWISKENSNGAAGADAVAKADILGAKTGGGAVLGVQSSTVLGDSNNVMSYTETKRRADSYNIVVTHIRNSSSDQNARQRGKLVLGTSSMDTFTSYLNSTVSTVSRTIDAVTATSVSWLPHLFLPNLHIEEQRISWSISPTGTTNAAITAIQNLSESVGTGTSQDLWATNSVQYRALVHKSNYLRRDPAYHPNAYKNQVMFGLPIGNSDFNRFNDDCFMKFDKRPCKENNGFYDYINDKHSKLYTIKSVLQCDFTNFISIAKSLAMRVIISAIEGVVRNKIEDIIMKPANKAIDDVTNTLSNVSSDLTNIESISQTQIDELNRAIDSSVDKAIEAISP
ncbi:MAG: hypothetical protein NT027_13125 [Proteobacteria bacterium]|nr:hypothetical protein [Pseudomonadota bacterium]